LSRWHFEGSCHPQGEPDIRGTWVPVSVIVGSIAEGDTVEKILGSHAKLQREDVRAALLHAAEAIHRPSPGKGGYQDQEAAAGVIHLFPGDS